MVSSGPSIDSKLLALLKELPDRVSGLEGTVSSILIDLKKLTYEDLAAKLKAISAQLFKKADQDKVTTTFGMHESKLSDLEQKLRDLKES